MSTKTLLHTQDSAVEPNLTEELFETLFNSLQIGVYVVQDGKFVFANPQFLTDIGFTEDELIGTTSLNTVHPEDRQFVREETVKRLKGEKSSPYEFRTTTKDGQTRIVIETMASIQYQGKRAALGSHMDITERKQMEEALRVSQKRYQSYIEVAGGLGWVTDADGNVVEDIPSFRKFTGQCYEEVRGRGWSKAVHPDDLEHTIQAWSKAVQEKNNYETEYRLRRHDGEFRYFLARGVPVFEEDGSVSQWIGTCIDITERKRAEQVLERLSQQLQARVSELEAFSYGIAHDLRSPLLSIEGFSRLLRDDIKGQKIEKVEEDIRLLESGVRKIQQFFNRTLEYSRAGYQVKRTKNVSFSTIVKEVLTQLAEQVHSTGATVSLAETFPRVRVDRIRISQALTNLIQNSIKYRDKTRPLKIEIGYWLSKDETVFFVRDNGIGIDEGQTEKVFDLFYRGTADGEGSGVGLAIVKRIIEAHGGRIWAESQAGKGTTMCFTLPQRAT